MISTVLAMVLGLGVTRLLLGFVTVFRTRFRTETDWVTLAWAVILFATKLQYWWAINHLALTRAAFSFVDFLFLVALTLSLFLSAALILPSRPEDEDGSLRSFFERDGRYGLLALAGFLVLGFIANVVYFEEPLLALWALLDVPMIATPIIVFLTRSRRARAWLTAAYIPLVLIDFRVAIAGG